MISKSTKIVLATVCVVCLITNIHIGPMWPGFFLLGWIITDWTDLWWSAGR